MRPKVCRSLVTEGQLLLSQTVKTINSQFAMNECAFLHGRRPEAIVCMCQVMYSTADCLDACAAAVRFPWSHFLLKFEAVYFGNIFSNKQQRLWRLQCGFYFMVAKKRTESCYKVLSRPDLGIPGENKLGSCAFYHWRYIFPQKHSHSDNIYSFEFIYAYANNCLYQRWIIELALEIWIRHHLYCSKSESAWEILGGKLGWEGFPECDNVWVNTSRNK